MSSTPAAQERWSDTNRVGVLPLGAIAMLRAVGLPLLGFLEEFQITLPLRFHRRASKLRVYPASTAGLDRWPDHAHNRWTSPGISRYWGQHCDQFGNDRSVRSGSQWPRTGDNSRGG
jgi:hypothetical protein